MPTRSKQLRPAPQQERCWHPPSSAVYRANQHAGWSTCKQCGMRLTYESRRAAPGAATKSGKVGPG
eukprot:698952-Lingulodinium_polyedra.AAC.1